MSNIFQNNNIFQDIEILSIPSAMGDLPLRNRVRPPLFFASPQRGKPYIFLDIPGFFSL